MDNVIIMCNLKVILLKIIMLNLLAHRWMYLFVVSVQGAKAAIKCTKASGNMYLQCNDGSVPHHWPGISGLVLLLRKASLYVEYTVRTKQT